LPRKWESFDRTLTVIPVNRVNLIDQDLLLVNPVIPCLISKQFFVDVFLFETRPFAPVIPVRPAFVTEFLIWHPFSDLVAMVPVEFGHSIGLDVVLCPRVKICIVNVIILMTFDPMPCNLYW
jgi:hypothetical protein